MTKLTQPARGRCRAGPNPTAKRGDAAMNRKVVVNDRMQRGYVYYRTEPHRSKLCPGVPAAAHSQANAGTGCIRRQVHDRRPRRVSGQLVRSCEALRRTPRRASQLLRRQRLAVARRVAAQGLDPSSGSAWLVPMVLPVLHGPPDRGRRAGRSDGGGRSRGTSPRFGRTARRATLAAVESSDRRCCIGPTTAASSRIDVRPRGFAATGLARTRLQRQPQVGRRDASRPNHRRAPSAVVQATPRRDFKRSLRDIRHLSASRLLSITAATLGRHSGRPTSSHPLSGAALWLPARHVRCLVAATEAIFHPWQDATQIARQIDTAQFLLGL